MKTNKKWHIHFSAIGILLFDIGFLLFLIDSFCFDRSFYRTEYAKDETAEKIGMSEEDLMSSTNTLLDYLEDDRDDIVIEVEVNGTSRQVFNERESKHMVDVKALYQNAKKGELILLITGTFFLFLANYLSKENQKEVQKSGYKYGVSFFLLFLSFLMIWIVSDFDGFWTNFHKLFFTNDLWLLDPNTSIMINMFPSIFFEDLVVRIIMFFAIFLVAEGILFYRPWTKLFRKKGME